MQLCIHRATHQWLEEANASRQEVRVQLVFQVGRKLLVEQIKQKRGKGNPEKRDEQHR